MIRQVLLAVFILFSAPSVASCASSDNLDQLIGELDELFDEQAELLNSIQTAEDLERVRKPFIRSLSRTREVSQKLEAYQEKIEADEALQQKFAMRLQASQGRLQQALNALDSRLEEEVMVELLAMMEEAA